MATPTVKFKNVKIKAVKPYDNNPRENSGAVGYVAASIAEFGFKRPLVVDENMVLLAGHTRLMALQQLGVETVLVAVVKGLTEEEKIAYRIKDNRAGELTLFDFEKVEKEILTFSGIDMTRFGFEPIKVEPPDAVDLSVTDIGGEKTGDGEVVICPRCGKVVC
jgi:site-specific DNA-methyltransferase (adenine-specific)